MKKYTIVFNEGIPMIGTILGIYYYLERNFNFLHQDEIIRLVTLVYLKKTNEIVEIENVNLSKRLLKRYNGTKANEKNLKELEELGIHNIGEVSHFIDEFNDYHDRIEYEKYKNSKKSSYNEEMYQKMLLINDYLNENNLIETKEKALLLRLNDKNKNN